MSRYLVFTFAAVALAACSKKASETQPQPEPEMVGARVIGTAGTEEKAAQQVQSAPLGLNGDTAKKKKRTKVKGEPKERIQQKPKEPAAREP